MSNKQVVIYDGDCLVCNQFIQLILRQENGSLLVTPRNSSYAKSLLEGKALNEKNIQDTIYFWENDVLYTHSTAILKILTHLSPAYKWLGKLLFLIPRFIRDAAYKLFAKHRHKWANIISRKSCIILSDQQKARVIY